MGIGNLSLGKLGKKRFMALLLAIGIAILSVAFALMQTKSSLAVLTEPPPGIPGPYYVTAEAKIYGPVIDLALIKSKIGGEYGPDYTYVQWGTNPFYRVYIDNTLQEVYYGQLVDITYMFADNFAIENNIKNTFNSLKNVGAVDPCSELGQIFYFGNLPGTFICIFSKGNLVTTIRTDTHAWYATGVGIYDKDSNSALAYFSTVTVKLNGSACITYSADCGKAINASGIKNGLLVLNWDISMVHGQYALDWMSVTIYLEDLVYIESTLSSEKMRIYRVNDSPGTGFVSKLITPSSPVIGSIINVTVRLDPPCASKMNITDFYPQSFSWTNNPVMLQKYKLGVGLVASVSVTVTPVSQNPNMKFTITWNQAPSVLEAIEADEYIYMSYRLIAPTSAGEYTLPSAEMSYFIPMPQT